MAARVFTGLCLLVSFCGNAPAQVNVLMRGLDTNRTGANLNETVLTPGNVNANTFGKLFTVHTDGQIFTQPLYVSNLSIAGGTHNVVFVGSMRNTMYAIDADSGTVLWSQNFGTPMIAAQLENDDNVVRANGGVFGILGTPVIDPNTNYMYFVSAEQPNDGTNFYYNLNAIDITDGSPVHGSPVTISATYQTADLNSPLVFNATRQNARSGLVLANGNVYICFSSHEDQDPYYGWVMAYSASTLRQVAVYSDTTLGTYVNNSRFTGGWGGIWMAGQAPAVDSAGNLYLSSGNGSYGKTPNGLTQTGNSFMKLSPQLELMDYFTPSNTSDLNNDDGDLGSSGLLLIPDTNYVLGGGKQGVLYLANTNGMGGYNSGSDQVRQEFQAVIGYGTSHIHSGAIYYNSSAKGPSVYVWGENDVLRAFQFNATTGKIVTNPFDQSTMTAPATNTGSAMPGGFLSISANGNNSGVLWASTPYAADASKQLTEGVLYAFDATNLNLLWSDKDNDGRDDVGLFAKFVPPVVANGKMYVPNFGTPGTNDSSGNLLCYGLLQAQPPTLTVAANNATRVYNTANPTFTGTVTGAQNGDTFTESFTTSATTASPAGTYSIVPTASGANLNDYTVNTVDGTLTITQVTQTINFPAIASQAYGSAPFAVAATSSAGTNYPVTITVQSGPATIAGGTVSLTGAGTVVLQASQAGDVNHSAATTTQTFMVTAAPLTVTANNATRVYNAANPAFSGTVTGAQNGDTFTETFSTTATQASIAGSYPIVPTASGAQLANYTVTTNNGALTITPATQTINFPATASRPYGSAAFAVAATSSAGTNYPVTITVQSGPATVSGGMLTLTGAGTVVLQASQAGDTNYSAATATQSFMATPAQLTVTANNATRVYNTANPAFSGTMTGAQNGDTFTETFTTTATTNADAGSYPIVPTASGAQLASYTVTAVNGALTVTAAPTTTTLSAPTTANAQSNVPLSASVASTGVTPVGQVSFYATFAGGTTLLGTSMLNGSGLANLNTTTLALGTGSLTASYAATSNFAASTSAASNIMVNPAAQTITFPAIANQVYGSAAFTVSATSSLGNGYPVTISVQSGPATISGGIVSVNAVGTVVLLATQAGDAQHSSATATQSLQVTPASLSVVAANASRIYGAANPAFTGSVTGAVGSDSFTESFSTTATASSAAGSYPIVPAVSGPVANYTVTTTNGALIVDPAPVGTYTVTASPTSLTVNIGQSVNTMLTFSPTNGYSGTITLSCSGLPADTSCSFAQNSVTLTGNNQTATVGLIINSATQSVAQRAPQTPALLALAFWWPGGLTGLAVFMRKRRSNMPRLAQLGLLLLCTCAFAAGLSGCGIQGVLPTQGTSQVSVVATGTGASGTATQSVMLSLTVTP